MMAYIDDVNAIRARADQARKDMNAQLKIMEDYLYGVIRPLPAAAWMSDAVLRIACNSFAQVAIQQTVTPVPVLADPGKTLTNG